MTDEHIQTGRTPSPISGGQDLRLWAGMGTGARCAQCGLAVAAADVEYEVETHSSGALTFHVRCFDQWRSKTVFSAGRSMHR